ncbi:hypothetical protein G5B37_03640 [Rasiella rasia]|uniref:Lipoprotein n=1 Tax=Rasiella rasia TaxID=2744027 RepID=A0A6G6GJJ2_9FLAO|nr:hypothetical protein [Rasiella rasia]QIE58684.1 hypothetical protein G5B37_03640 [Rasiella rasia]
MKTTKFILIFIVTFFVFTSCKQKEITDLKNQISELSKKNIELKDSISQLELKNLYAFHILGGLETTELKVNQESTVDFFFAYKDYIHKYDLYRITGDGENDRELIKENNELSEFQYTYTPKDKNDNHIRLVAVFDLDSIGIEIPANLKLPISD